MSQLFGSISGEKHQYEISKPVLHELAKRATRIKELEEALKFYKDECLICNGTGINNEAKQAWDIPGVPDEPCHYCRRSVEALTQTQEKEG